MFYSFKVKGFVWFSSSFVYKGINAFNVSPFLQTGQDKYSWLEFNHFLKIKNLFFLFLYWIYARPTFQKKNYKNKLKDETNKDVHKVWSPVPLQFLGRCCIRKDCSSTLHLEYSFCKKKKKLFVLEN